MYSTSASDLEEIPLEDDDLNSLEFKILAFYVRHHAFKKTPAAFSPELLRTGSVSQRGLESLSANESLTQVPWVSRNSRSSEKFITSGKKKSSWRAILGVLGKEEDEQDSSPVLQSSGIAVTKGISSISTVDAETEGRYWGAHPLMPSLPFLVRTAVPKDRLRQGSQCLHFPPY